MTDYLITITDQDALDAIDQIIQVNGLGEKPEDVIAGMLVPQLVVMRGQQLTNAAQVAAANDPNVLAFQSRQEAKIAAQIQPLPEPAVKVLP